MPSGDPKDRRDKPRFRRRLPVRFGTETRMCGGIAVDISESGMRVEAPETFPVHSLLDVFVQFPNHAVRLHARVMWSGGGAGTGGGPAMGLAFTHPERSLIKAYNAWRAEVQQSLAEGPASTAGPAPAAPTSAPPAPPPVVAEPRGPLRRRMESRQGQSYDVLLEPRTNGWHLTIVQLPHQLGVQGPDHEGQYPDYATAENAMREFVRSH